MNTINYTTELAEAQEYYSLKFRALQALQVKLGTALGVVQALEDWQVAYEVDESEYPGPITVTVKVYLPVERLLHVNQLVRRGFDLIECPDGTEGYQVLEYRNRITPGDDDA